MRTPEDNPPPGGELIRFGTVAEVDLGAARCTVRVGDLLSGPIRWIESRVGATRTWSPPTEGEQVLLLCPEGELEAGVALRGIVCQAFAPAGTTLRELIRFQDGAELAYDPVTHVLDAVLPAGATTTIVSQGGITLDAREGGLQVIGDVAVQGDVVAKGISLTEHKHTGVAVGTAVSGTPQ